MLAAVFLPPLLPAQAKRPMPDVEFDAKPGSQVPFDAQLISADGKPVTIGGCLRGRPVVLALVYYECPMLCGEVLNGLFTSLNAVDLVPGRDYEVLLVSIDPAEGPELARAKRASVLERYGRSDTEAGWHFLTGGEEAIRRVAAAIGFRYAYVPETRQFAHAAGIVVLTPEGKISRALYGVEYPPRDLRLSLIEASGGKIGGATARLLLLCYAWDPSTGRYGFAIMSVLRAGAVATVAGLAGLIGLLLWRERRRRTAAG
jgi:protein SCO1/2